MQYPLKDIQIGYREEQPLIASFDLTLEVGKVKCVWGRNGSGKTTLLRTIAGLIDPLKGAINIPQKSIGMVNQFRPNVPNLSVEEYLTFGGISLDGQDWFGYRGFLKMPLSQLSDGQFKLIAIVRQILKQPKVFLLDEPTAFLDIYAKSEFVEVINKLKQEMAILLISHDLQFITNITDEAFELNDGTLVARPLDYLSQLSLE